MILKILAIVNQEEFMLEDSFDGFVVTNISSEMRKKYSYSPIVNDIHDVFCKINVPTSYN